MGPPLADLGGGGDGDATAFCDEEGNFVLRGLDSGALDLKAIGRGYSSNDPTIVEVGMGEEVDGVRVVVDRAYVQDRLKKVAEDDDLSRYIL